MIARSIPIGSILVLLYMRSYTCTIRVLQCCALLRLLLAAGYLIPIALYVSIEMVKIVQSLVFIGQDRSMYHADTDTPAVARTSNLNEELGMVNTILSDKVRSAQGCDLKAMGGLEKCSCGTSPCTEVPVLVAEPLAVGCGWLGLLRQLTAFMHLLLLCCRRVR
jgi:hypothetical protein